MMIIIINLINTSQAQIDLRSRTFSEQDELLRVKSDPRCPIQPYLPEKIELKTKYGNLIGYYVYLCDSPYALKRERPSNVQNFNNQPPNYINNYAKTFYNISVFLGIPYAKPPSQYNNLRFRPPQRPNNWGLLNANKFGDACPQSIEHTGKDRMIPQISEDCLYLNVFSPYSATRLNTQFPVMIYIHDGDYDHGTGNTFPAHMLAASQQVIVVTFNYRLGLLGFLSTANNASVGNYGSLDQVMAIKWVYENINIFNGDPGKITLFGPGSGAASSILLALSPLSRKYVKRVIAQSGSPLSQWAVNLDPVKIRNISLSAALTYGCPTFDSFKLVECLTSRSYSEMAYSQVKPSIGWLPWTPVLDHFTVRKEVQFMPFDPEEFLKYNYKLFDNKLDAFLTGVNSEDGANVLLKDQHLRENDYTVTRRIFDEQIAKFVNIYNATLNPDEVKKAISFMYIPYSDPDNHQLLRKGLIDMYSDYLYTSGVNKMVNLMSKNKVKTFMYVLNYTIDHLDKPKWTAATHNTEYFLITGAPFLDASFYPRSLKLNNLHWTEEDRNMSLFLMESWANFAKFGEPTSVKRFNIFWEQFTYQNNQYLSINTTNLTSVMRNDYKQRESNFWSNYLPTLIFKPPTRWPTPFEPIEEELRVFKAATWAGISVIIVLLSVTIICTCLYCRAKRDRIGDAAIDYNFDVNHYSAPSTRANSEISLNARGLRQDVVTLPLKGYQTAPKTNQQLKQLEKEKLRSMPLLPTNSSPKLVTRYQRIPRNY